MADFGISIAERLIEVIGCSLIKEICDVWGYKSELEELNKTVCIIKNLLLDAESKRELITNNERDYVDELKAVAYDADDLFDEFLTLAQLKQLDVGKKTKFSKKVRNFFSLKKKEVTQACRMSHQVKDIKKQLDVIVNKRNMFNLSFNYQPIINRKEETCSYVVVNDIIGRETDKKAVIDMLLAPNKDVEDNFRFMTIVGVGGLGKTALAQLVYNDDEVKNEFSGESALRCWVCVSDQDGEQFDLKSTLCKILDSVSGEKPSDALSLESVKNQFQLKFSGKKYLLILDDLWNEDLDKWLELKKFLTLGQGGSRIVVTTRSERTSKVVGDDKHMYKLGGLSEEDSWSLFEMIAFINRNNEDVNHLELVEIGKSIVRKCYNNPLVIKVVGSLLFDQGVSTWRLFEEKGLSEIGNIGNDGNNEIMSILKFSYYNLTSSLKSCFSYCAIFPKDTRIKKHELISLWMAQGFVVPFHGCQSIDDAGEEHFLILLRRCFFQDVERDDMGDTMSVKIHDLMHDVAQEVGRGEIFVSSSFADNVGAKIRHVHYIGDACSEKIIFKSKIRSFICEGPLVDKQLDNWMCLRVLVMTESSLVSLPDSIGKLLHLRYLNLSWNYCLETLPDSITELHNLETLILYGCEELRELPVNFSRLLNLRHLDLTDCDKLVNMPSGMNKLSSLRLLPFFAVGRDDSILDGKQCKERLESLKSLTNIKGGLEIRIGKNYRIVEGKNNDSGGDYLKGMKHLTCIAILFEFEERVVVPLPDEYENEYDHPHEYVLEKLEPPSSIKEFRVRSFDGYKIPKWGRAVDNWGAMSFPCLVTIEIESCKELKQMPSLAELPYLKCIILADLYKLEYMENRSEGEILKPIYPSLEVVKIYNLPELKGWWRGEGGDITRTFPCLSELRINDCESLKTFPPCPRLEDLTLLGCNDATGFFQDGVTRLKSMRVDKVDYRSLNASLLHLKLRNVSDNDMQIAMNGVQYLTSLQTLGFYYCEMEALPEWIINLLSLRTLSLFTCRNLKSLPDSMKKLTSLQTLNIAGCDVEIEEKFKPDGEDWPNIKHIPNIHIRYGDIIRN